MMKTIVCAAVFLLVHSTIGQEASEEVVDNDSAPQRSLRLQFGPASASLSYGGPNYQTLPANLMNGYYPRYNYGYQQQQQQYPSYQMYGYNSRPTYGYYGQQNSYGYGQGNNYGYQQQQQGDNSQFNPTSPEYYAQEYSTGSVDPMYSTAQELGGYYGQQQQQQYSYGQQQPQYGYGQQPQYGYGQQYGYSYYTPQQTVPSAPTASVEADPTSTAASFVSGSPAWRKSYTPLPGQSGCFNRCRPSCGQAAGFGYGCRPSCGAACNVRPSCGARNPVQWVGNTMVCGRPNYNYGGYTPLSQTQVTIPTAAPIAQEQEEEEEEV